MNLESSLKKFFQEKKSVQVAILFGSYANGKNTDNSDVDLAVQLPTPLNAQEKYALIFELREITGLDVDLIDLRTAGQPILGQIFKHPVRLKGSDSDFAELTITNVNTTQDFMPYIERMQKERRDNFLNG